MLREVSVCVGMCTLHQSEDKMKRNEDIKTI